MPTSALSTRDRVLGTVAVLAAVTAGYLHLKRTPSSTELGGRLVSALERGDALAVAALFPDEELSATGMTRDQATQIVREIVLPDAGLLADNVVRVTLNGNSVALEKPKGDPRYFQPPTILLAHDEHGRPFLGLGNLLSSVWGYRLAENKMGRSLLDPRAQIERDFQRAKQLGMVKSMDWSRHEVHDVPEHPYGPIPDDRPE